MRLDTRSKTFAATLAIFLGACSDSADQTTPGSSLCLPDEANISLSQLQWIGTHNSYHIAPDRALLDYMVSTNFNAGDYWDGKRLSTALDFTHPPLQEQLEMGLRHFELDLYDDPQGGKYATPGFLKVLPRETVDQLAPVDPQGDLLGPGFKVFHTPDSDVRSTCLTLQSCLANINEWRAENTNHLPIILNFEVKNGGGDVLGPQYSPVSPVDVTADLWRRLHEELKDAFGSDALVLPRDVRGDFDTVRDAVVANGWPTLESARGKVVLFLLDSRADNQSYVDYGVQSDEDRLLHVALGTSHAETSWLNQTLEEDAAGNYEGFLNYARADVSGDEARSNDPARRDAALASGAQIVSTDFPIPRAEYSPYHVMFEGGYVRYKGETCSETLSE